MALRTLVKISSVNNLSDARYAAGMGVELMGFDLNELSNNYISPEQFAAITSWVSGVKLVGEITAENLDDRSIKLDQYPLDYLQICMSSPDQPLASTTLPIIIKIDKPEKELISACLEQYSSRADWFLIELSTPMPEELLAWCTLQAQTYPILLGNNVTSGNVNDLTTAGFKGIALRGGDEIRPGYKDFDELADILEALEVDT